MNDHLKRTILSINGLEQLRKLRMLNPVTGHMLLSDPEQMGVLLETATAVSKMLRSPFEQPDNSVDGPIKLATSENGIPIGIFPGECHVLIAGQTGTGKSTLLKILFSQALRFNRL